MLTFRPSRLAVVGFLLAAAPCAAQSPATREDEAVGAAINYVFATDLGSGVYDVEGRTLQLYRLTWRKELRETRADQVGVRFVLPVTAGFFDFTPLDVITSGPPTSVDSFSVVPGLEFDFLLARDWHLIPYARAGFSVASSSVDGWLFGAGLRAEKRGDFHGWDMLVRSDLAYAGVQYREQASDDEFMRLRQGFDLTRGLRWEVRGRKVELGLYAIFDAITDPPTVPTADAETAPLQAEFGFTFASRPRVKLWRFDMPRLGFGYRLAGELSAWRFVIGVPF
jgi:hypothetical protein